MITRKRKILLCFSFNKKLLKKIESSYFHASVDFYEVRADLFSSVLPTGKRAGLGWEAGPASRQKYLFSEKLHLNIDVSTELIICLTKCYRFA